MTLRDVLAYFGVARPKPLDLDAIRGQSLRVLARIGAVRPSPEPQGVQRLPVPVIATNGVMVRGFYERLVYDDARRHCIISTHDSLPFGYYIQETEVEIHGFQPADKVDAYLRYLADWEAAHR